MPIYEYQCQSCGEHTEFLQKHSDAPKTTCPHCKKEALSKKISAAGFQLKGTGWYVTDFRGKKESTPANQPATKATKKQAEKKEDK